MGTDLRLGWVQRNRARPQRQLRLGERIVDLVNSSALVADTTRSKLVASTLTGLVDKEFRGHCRVVVTDRDAVVINVDHPGRVYAMRARWLKTLGRALEIQGRCVPMDAIRFVHGTAGVAL